MPASSRLVKVQESASPAVTTTEPVPSRSALSVTVTLAEAASTQASEEAYSRSWLPALSARPMVPGSTSTFVTDPFAVVSFAPPASTVRLQLPAASAPSAVSEGMFLVRLTCALLISLTKMQVVSTVTFSGRLPLASV